MTGGIIGHSLRNGNQAVKRNEKKKKSQKIYREEKGERTSVGVRDLKFDFLPRQLVV